MSYRLDPEVAAGMAAFAAAAGGRLPALPVGDVAGRRAREAASSDSFSALAEPVDGVVTSDHRLARGDGGSILLRWYAKEGVRPGSAALWIHGGGMIMGSVEADDADIQAVVSETGVPLLAVDYRLAPEHPHPVPVEDCYAALVWLADHAAELGVDPARIGVAGASAGGGLAAGVALLARDRGGPALAGQILIYPMLDDRTPAPPPALDRFLTWTHDDNQTGWRALLGDAAGGNDVPIYAAPARAGDLAGLPPTYLDVGQLDLFLDEDIEYARRIAATGTPVELHVHPGLPHGCEDLAPEAGVSRRLQADRLRALRSL